MNLMGNVLVTGGSGTLGRALVRTAYAQNWDAAFTVYSRSEFLQAQMRREFPEVRYVLGDVRDYDRLESAIAGHATVIHAAAMKRIPECEAHPTECFATNILGSQNVVRACLAQNVERCVGVSTDKACQAVTAYGASKLALEKIFKAQAARGHFVLVRYGNVVASRGSVIPIWRKQAEQGLPLSVTDLGATRFWMSESMAVQTVLRSLDTVSGHTLIESGTFLHPSGSILIPKLGSLSLKDMAHIVAPGAGLDEIGWRSLEKRHEWLVHADECVEDLGDYYLEGGNGKLGQTYTSLYAPRLSREAFLAMLKEAEESE